jgi:hypothetical protein
MGRKSTGTVPILNNDAGKPQWHAKWTRADGSRSPWMPLSPRISSVDDEAGAKAEAARLAGKVRVASAVAGRAGAIDFWNTTGTKPENGGHRHEPVRHRTGPRPDPTSAKTLCKTKRRFGNVQQDSSARTFTESRVGGDRAGATFRWPHFLATFHSAPHLRLSHGPAAVSSAARSDMVMAGTRRHDRTLIIRMCVWLGTGLGSIRTTVVALGGATKIGRAATLAIPALGRA